MKEKQIIIDYNEYLAMVELVGYIEKIDNAVKGNIIQEIDPTTGEANKRVKMTKELNNLLLEICE